MKKIFTLAAMVFALAGGVQAQTYNLFAPWAVDSNGWLWFDTADKIKTYVGNVDDDNYKADVAGKIVQIAEANHGSYEKSVVSDTITGVGGTGATSGFGVEGALRGSIVLSPASALMAGNGGGLLLKLPSLATLSIKLSSEDRKLVVVRATKTPAFAIDRYDMTFNTYNTVFKRLGAAGLYEWTGVETLTNTAGNSIVSNDAIYVFIQNSSTKPLYIHGIKVMTPKQETVGINDITVASSAAITDVYTAEGVLVKRGVSEAEVKNLTKGLYILRSGKDVKKVVVE